MSNIKEQIQSWVATEAQPLLTGYYQSRLRNLPIPELTVKFGQKYAQVWNGTIIWAFIALADEPTKAQVVGDLLKPASWRAPAKHSRGNILTGSASFGPYGPSYMNSMNPLK